MSYSKEDIYTKISDVLQETFDIAANDIKPEARMYEDLDIDSIDAVDLMIELKSITGKKMALDDFQQVRTIGDIVDAVYKIVSASVEPS